MWSLIVAALRSIATAAGIVHEPSVIAVRVHSHHDPERIEGERAA